MNTLLAPRYNWLIASFACRSAAPVSMALFRGAHHLPSFETSKSKSTAPVKVSELRLTLDKLEEATIKAVQQHDMLKQALDRHVSLLGHIAESISSSSSTARSNSGDYNGRRRRGGRK
ncbi:hypothetical protein M427DRAFT_54096 [Gonapodya prolifera JEL478]|uniref:Uncharacterized protein n=1 Tax=Gonapodya prolifera (strain JEL478) TaxID=1344416 RepID=A0A139ANJ7_GONPJ|nr:hypothetical protein M427DRAFT_54096 [Gonapodya prolifera JEL478]|eukprot:KXS18298.1 hypothetical protein M427DRAFT_54096 [Gonapodya prolifera JEL478]